MTDERGEGWFVTGLNLLVVLVGVALAARLLLFVLGQGSL